MTVTKLTKSGKVEITSGIIDWLKLQPSDSINFPIAPDNKVYLQPAKIDVRELSGMLYKAGIKAGFFIKKMIYRIYKIQLKNWTLPEKH